MSFEARACGAWHRVATMERSGQLTQTAGFRPDPEALLPKQTDRPMLFPQVRPRKSKFQFVRTTASGAQKPAQRSSRSQDQGSSSGNGCLLLRWALAVPAGLTGRAGLICTATKGLPPTADPDLFTPRFGTSCGSKASSSCQSARTGSREALRVHTFLTWARVEDSPDHTPPKALRTPALEKADSRGNAEFPPQAAPRSEGLGKTHARDVGRRSASLA